MEKIKIKLSNGKEITDLTMNGNNFVSETEITEAMFVDGLNTVVIEYGDHKEIYNNMILVQIQPVGEEWYFILREPTQYEKDMAKIRSDLEYLAMMTDVDIDA